MCALSRALLSVCITDSYPREAAGDGDEWATLGPGRGRHGMMGCTWRRLRMETTPRWGITLPLRSLPLPDQRDLVAALPDLGYTDAWSSEVNGADAFTPLAVAAQWTTGLRFGTAIAGIYTRGPALLAMDAATCASLAPGRFVLGIGTSSPVIVEDWNGLKLDRPYQRARDTLKFLRPALAGEKVSGEFETFTVRGFRLDPPPVQPPGLALAALRPGMVRLAATLA